MIRARSLLACLFVAAAAAAPASAQGLRELVAAWALGDYRGPLFCVVDGAAREALRRVRIQPPRPVDPPGTLRVTFHDLEAPAGISCSTLSGERERNVVGVLQLAFDGRDRPDTGEVDFRNTLRREGGFGYRITGGVLRVVELGAGADASPEPVDFAGGTAEIREVPPGSDAARRLAVFGSARERTLRLISAGGLELVFDLVELPRR